MITAAHCLPFLPPAISYSYSEEKTYRGLLAALGDEPTIWAECFFVDPVSDLAILAAPEDQNMSDEFSAYENLVDGMEAIEIAAAARDGDAFLLSLESEWHRCRVQHLGSVLWFSEALHGIHGGMSGSPVIDSEGRAIGVVCTSGGGDGVHTEGGPNPNLTLHLPNWVMALGQEN